jgi:hypothetical protein
MDGFKLTKPEKNHKLEKPCSLIPFERVVGLVVPSQPEELTKHTREETRPSFLYSLLPFQSESETDSENFPPFRPCVSI